MATTVAEAEEFVTYSLAEVSEMTRIPLGQLYGYVHDGDIHVLLPRGAKRGWRVTRNELRRFTGGGEPAWARTTS